MILPRDSASKMAAFTECDAKPQDNLSLVAAVSLYGPLLSYNHKQSVLYDTPVPSFGSFCDTLGLLFGLCLLIVPK